MIKKNSDLKKINTNLNLQRQWPTGGAWIFKEKWAWAGNREQIGWSCSSNVSLSGPLVGLGFLTKKTTRREQGKRAARMFGKVKNKKRTGEESSSGVWESKK